MTKVPFDFDYDISFNVLDVVSQFYPALSEDEKQTIAYEVVKNYDYSITFEDLLTPIWDAAADNGIFLEGKDGVKEEEDNIYVLNTPKSALFKWSQQQYLSHPLLNVPDVVEEGNILCVPTAHQFQRSIIFHGLQSSASNVILP